MKNNKGFTLIELLVVTSVIAILGAVAITGYIGVNLKATRSEAYASLEALRMHEAEFFAERDSYTDDLANFPSFRPPPTAKFTYAIQSLGQALPAPPVPVPYGGQEVGAANCFIATATGIAGTRVEDDVFAIDCFNNRNF